MAATCISASNTFLEKLDSIEKSLRDELSKFLSNPDKNCLILETEEVRLTTVFVSKTLEAITDSSNYPNYFDKKNRWVIEFEDLVRATMENCQTNQTISAGNELPSFPALMVCGISQEASLNAHQNIGKEIMRRAVEVDNKKIIIITIKCKFVDSYVRKLSGVVDKLEVGALWLAKEGDDWGNILSFTNNDSQTLLHLGASNGSHELVATLLKHGADTQLRDTDLKTPLHVAAEKGFNLVVKMLIEGKSNINVKNRSGYTPLHYAARYGHEEVVATLLLNGADCQAGDGNENTPLHIAARNGHNAVVKMLIDGKSNINVKNKDGYTPLHYAVKLEHKEVVKTLFENNAGSDLELNESNKLFQTPLDLAILSRNNSIVNYLKSKGAKRAEELTE